MTSHILWTRRTAGFIMRPEGWSWWRQSRPPAVSLHQFCPKCSKSNINGMTQMSFTTNHLTSFISDLFFFVFPKSVLVSFFLVFQNETVAMRGLLLKSSCWGWEFEPGLVSPVKSQTASARQRLHCCVRRRRYQSATDRGDREVSWRNTSFCSSCPHGASSLL